MHLPDIDGLELLRHLKAGAETADIPVVVVSADALPAQIEAALQAGALHYLTKPVSVAELLAAVDEVLGKLHSQLRLNRRARWVRCAGESQRTRSPGRLRADQHSHP